MHLSYDFLVPLSSGHNTIFIAYLNVHTKKEISTIKNQCFRLFPCRHALSIKIYSKSSRTWYSKEHAALVDGNDIYRHPYYVDNFMDFILRVRRTISRRWSYFTISSSHWQANQGIALWQNRNTETRGRQILGKQGRIDY